MAGSVRRSGDDLDAVPLRIASSPLAADGEAGRHDALNFDTLSISGWAERNVRALLRRASRSFPECGFAFVTFEPGCDRPRKVVVSEGAEDAVASFLAARIWRPEWFADGKTRTPAAVQGLRSFAAPFHIGNEIPLRQQHALVFAVSGPMPAIMAAWKPATYGAFREPDTASLHEAADAASKALRLSVELAASQMTDLAASLNRFKLGYMAIDEAFQLVHTNATADDLLEEGRYVLRAGDALKFADQSADARLRQLLRHLAGKSRQAEDAEGVIAVRSGDGTHLARLVANVQRDTDDSLLGPPLFAITISQNKSLTGVEPAQLRRQGFTSAEAELAANLMRGLTIAQHAKERGIAVATARAHLKRAMMRVGVHRQPDLIRYIVGLS